MAVALELHNSFVIEEANAGLNINITGYGAGFLEKSVANLVVQVLRSCGKSIGKGVSGLRINIENKVPIGVGFGGSAAAVLAGVLASKSIFESSWSRHETIDKCLTHESNAAAISASLLGGGSVAVRLDTRVNTTHIDVAPMRICLAAPIFQSTDDLASAERIKRSVPADQDAGLSLYLLESLRTANYVQLNQIMMAIDYSTLDSNSGSRFGLVASSAIEAGAALVIPSNFGPGVAAFTESSHEAVCEALKSGLGKAYGGEVQSWIVPISTYGISLSELNSISTIDSGSATVMIERDS